ncbi:hypothetical protein GCM10017673_54720 [Streptosporangium violaceochromogenes]|nr:hypothetical protein GCM10017673_54720 [Streptosporangium violaceochromogenes]
MPLWLTISFALNNGALPAAAADAAGPAADIVPLIARAPRPAASARRDAFTVVSIGRGCPSGPGDTSHVYMKGGVETLNDAAEQTFCVFLPRHTRRPRLTCANTRGS